jgi:hypothetical protein
MIASGGSGIDVPAFNQDTCDTAKGQITGNPRAGSSATYNQRLGFMDLHGKRPSLSVDSQCRDRIKNMKLVEVQDNPDPVVYADHFFPVTPGDKRCAIKKEETAP